MSSHLDDFTSFHIPLGCMLCCFHNKSWEPFLDKDVTAVSLVVRVSVQTFLTPTHIFTLQNVFHTVTIYSLLTFHTHVMVY